MVFIDLPRNLKTGVWLRPQEGGNSSQPDDEPLECYTLRVCDPSPVDRHVSLHLVLSHQLHLWAGTMNRFSLLILLLPQNPPDFSTKKPGWTNHGLTGNSAHLSTARYP